MSEPTPSQPDFQAGMKDAWWFAAFNGLSFQIILGSPMILYAQTLNANATVLGIIAGMTPLMIIFQIPTVQYINRFGYKRFVLGGWVTRTFFIVGMVLIPLSTPFLDNVARLVLMLALLFCFNMLRGIATCGWLPWITHLVPENYRGRYVAGDAAMSNLGSFLTIIISAVCLGKTPQPWQFSLIFALSAAMAVVSLTYLNKVPDIPLTETVRSSSHPVPWLEIMRHPPFQKLLVFMTAWAVAYGGFTTFIVAFLKARIGMPDARVLFVTSVAFLGGLSSLWFLGSRLDHVGSKPILRLSLSVWLVIAAGWIAIAGGAVSAHPSLILALQFFMGLFAALVGMAGNRLAMVIIPTMGRNHFFVLYSVFANVSLGLAPIFWGIIIDLIGSRQRTFLGVNWNQYSIFFSLTLLTFIVTLRLARKLHEPKAASFETLLTQIMIESPQRLWLRIWSA